MDKIINSTPAPYPKNNTEEITSVITFLNLIDKKFIKPDINFLDRVPSMDGQITVVDSKEISLGKLEVQVKTLPDVHLNAPKFQCDTAFLAACEESVLPVLLVVVNSASELAYWLHIDRQFLKQIALSINGQSVSIKFPKENCISKGEKSHVKRWTDILTGHKKKLIDYELMADKVRELEKLIEISKKFPKPVHTIESKELKAVQTFIDAYNEMISGDFKILKEMYYDDCWKIGIGYSNF